MSKRLISLDVGNVDTKAVSSTEMVTFPSVVALEQGAIRFNGFGKDNEFVIEFEGSRVALGDSAFKLGRLQVAEMGRQRIEGAAYRRQVAGALVSVLGQSTPLVMVASLPVKFYTGAREEMRDLLVGDTGEYRVGFRKKTSTFKIRREDTHIIPEAFGSLCTAILNRHGQVVDGTLINKRVAVIDIGGRTTDGLLFDELDLVPAGCFGLEKTGMSLLWAMLDEQIEARYGRTLNLLELDAAMRHGFFMHGPDKIDLREEIDAAAAALADTVMGAINSEWDGGNAVEQILFTGGGAAFIFPWMPYPHAVLINERDFGCAPHQANAQGAFRFALARKFAE